MCEVQVDMEARIDELEGRARRLADRNRRLEGRRAADMDGWISDVTLLRKQIAAVDRKLTQMRVMERLPDDERRDAILAKHARLAPAPLGDVYELAFHELVDEMRGLKASLLGMGQRVREQAELQEEDEE